MRMQEPAQVGSTVRVKVLVNRTEGPPISGVLLLNGKVRVTLGEVDQDVDLVSGPHGFGADQYWNAKLNL